MIMQNVLKEIPSKSGKVLGAALLLLAVAGCGTLSANESASQGVAKGAVGDEKTDRLSLGSVPTAPTKGLAKGLTLPLNNYLYSAQERYAWQVATQDQWRSCMKGFSFEGFNPPAPLVESTVAQVETGMGRRYGVSDLSSVQKNGYHLDADTPESPRWEPTPGAEEAVFTGDGPEISEGKYEGRPVPEGGCRGEAARMFPMPQSTEAEEAEAQAFSLSQSDPRTVKAMTAWSSCMKSKGFTVASPLKAPDLVRDSLAATEPAAEEIRLATADVNCKKQSNLIPTWHGVEKAMQGIEITKRQSELSQVKKEKESAVAKFVQAYKKGAK
ncbi:hypothetical protein ACIP93_00755 [Streptomyces sp. NPDC088745]|uniref:hypothetical protein n=1 Tax=Streptomyces sp. NPDC088745 TaxID=3365884 RepID=UPI0038239BFB